MFPPGLRSLRSPLPPQGDAPGRRHGAGSCGPARRVRLRRRAPLPPLGLTAAPDRGGVPGWHHLAMAGDTRHLGPGGTGPGHAATPLTPSSAKLSWTRPTTEGAKRLDGDNRIRRVVLEVLHNGRSARPRCQTSGSDDRGLLAGRSPDTEIARRNPSMRRCPLT